MMSEFGDAMRKFAVSGGEMSFHESCPECGLSRDLAEAYAKARSDLNGCEKDHTNLRKENDRLRAENIKLLLQPDDNRAQLHKVTTLATTLNAENERLRADLANWKEAHTSLWEERESLRAAVRDAINQVEVYRERVECWQKIAQVRTEQTAEINRLRAALQKIVDWKSDGYEQAVAIEALAPPRKETT